VEIERESARGEVAGGGRGQLRRAALALAGGAALAGLLLGAERLPGWGLSWAGLRADFGGTGGAGDGAGQDAGAPGGAPPAATPQASSRYAFPTQPEAAAFAQKSGVRLVAPQWVPPGFSPEGVSVTLSQLPPEAAASAGRPQRVAATQRFAAADGNGQFTLVQSSPPPLFDLLYQYQRADGEVVQVHGVPAQYGEFPQGTVLYWRERGDRRSLGVIADPGASARLSRADWVRFAESLA
jgi:hypothetical protein